MEIYNSNNQNDNSPKKQCPFCASMMNVNCNYCPGCGSPMNIHEIQENSSRESNSTNPNDNIVFGVLSLVFGALGGLLGLVFGFYGLFNKKSGKNTKILCWIGITLFLLWIVALIVLYIILLLTDFNLGAKPYMLYSIYFDS